MSKLSSADEIWVVEATDEDRRVAAEYAAVTLPWTFNRMMYNSTSRSTRYRALNIAKGLVAQEALGRALRECGLSTEVDRTSYRETDFFDFKVATSEGELDLDIKTQNHYTDYRVEERPPFSVDLLVERRGYAGPDWRYFFPMLYAHTQVNQEKDALCFALATSIDFRNDVFINRDSYALTAFPYGRPMLFLSQRRLCEAREDAERGVFLECVLHDAGLLTGDGIRFSILGEWDGGPRSVEVLLLPDQSVDDIGPFSCVSAFQVEPEDYERLEGVIEITVSRNEFDDSVLNASRREQNTPPDEVLEIRRGDFCNLMLPSDYRLYVLGWIARTEFIEACREYTGWVWPDDSVNRLENQAWTVITDKDRNTITRAGFESSIQQQPPLVNAGWMKGMPRRGSASCYVYPNIHGGGLQETNLYVLPQDLETMASLCEI